MMPRFATVCWAICFFAAVGPGATPASQPAAPAKPTCAIIVEPGDSLNSNPSVPLLEAALQDAGQVTLVDRSAIADVLKEQQLSALFGADAVGGRIELGKLLRADLLVLIRTEAADPPRINLVVCQTKSGLRLLARSLTIGKNPDQDTAAWLDLVQQGIKRQSEPITEIFAIPPFVDRSFGYRAEQYKAGFARLLEEMVLRRPGALTVQLAEARALTQEIMLGKIGQGSDTIARRLPLYFIGEYQQEGSEDHPSLSFKLSLYRGETALASTHGSDIAPDKAAEVVRSGAAGLLEKVAAKTEAPAPDPVLESGQLAERAHAFAKLGEWDEAADLDEASLLLRPGQPAVEGEAANAIGALAQQAVLDQSDQNLVLPENRAKTAAVLRRGLPHIEAYMKATRMRQAYVFSILHPYLNVSICEEFGDVYIRVLRYKREHNIHDGTPNIGIDVRDKGFGTWLLQPEEKLRVQKLTRAWALRAAQEMPEWAPVGDVIALFPINQSREEVASMIDSLAACSNPACRKAADLVRAQVDSGEWGFPPKPGTPIPTVVRRPAPASQPADLPRLNLKATTITIEGVNGWIGAGKGIDAIWVNREDDVDDPDQFRLTLKIMKTRDRLLKVADIIGAYSRTPVCFDGKYLWAAARDPGAINMPSFNDEVAAARAAADKIVPRIYVCDPRTEQIWTIPLKDQVPQEPLIGFAAAALSPGHACVVGVIGRDYSDCRTWVALLSFDQVALRFRVDVVLTARDVPSSPSKPDEWKDAQLAFWPAYAYTLTEPAKPNEAPRQRVLIGRDDPLGVLIRHPLLIDPQAKTASVVQEKTLLAFSPCARDGAVYGQETIEGRNFYRFGFPELKPRPDGRQLPPKEGGRIRFVGERAVLFSRSATFISDGPLQPFRKLQLSFPNEDPDAGPDELFESQFYGPVIIAGYRRRAYAAQLPPPLATSQPSQP